MQYNYHLIGKNSEKWKLLGNTILTIFTEIIGKQLIKKYILFNICIFNCKVIFNFLNFKNDLYLIF